MALAFEDDRDYCPMCGEFEYYFNGEPVPEHQACNCYECGYCSADDEETLGSE